MAIKRTITMCGEAVKSTDVVKAILNLANKLPEQELGVSPSNTPVRAGSATEIEYSTDGRYLEFRNNVWGSSSLMQPEENYNWRTQALADDEAGWVRL